MTFRVAVAAAGLAAPPAARGTGGIAPAVPGANPSTYRRLGRPPRDHPPRHTGLPGPAGPAQRARGSLLRAAGELYRLPLAGPAATVFLITGGWK